jgi:predicted XRE-type DNA-binding protein
MRTYDSVWDALEDTPEQAESLKLRSVFMLAIEEHLTRQGGTQTEQARRLGLTQPRLNDLLKGRIHKFSLDALVNIAVRAGLQVDLNLREAA